MHFWIDKRAGLQPFGRRQPGIYSGGRFPRVSRRDNMPPPSLVPTHPPGRVAPSSSSSASHSGSSRQQRGASGPTAPAPSSSHPGSGSTNSQRASNGPPPRPTTLQYGGAAASTDSSAQGAGLNGRQRPVAGRPYRIGDTLVTVLDESVSPSIRCGTRAPTSSDPLGNPSGHQQQPHGSHFSSPGRTPPPLPPRTRPKPASTTVIMEDDNEDEDEEDPFAACAFSDMGVCFDANGDILPMTCPDRRRELRQRQRQQQQQQQPAEENDGSFWLRFSRNCFIRRPLRPGAILELQDRQREQCASGLENRPIDLPERPSPWKRKCCCSSKWSTTKHLGLTLCFMAFVLLGTVAGKLIIEGPNAVDYVNGVAILKETTPYFFFFTELMFVCGALALFFAGVGCLRKKTNAFLARAFNRHILGRSSRNSESGDEAGAQFPVTVPLEHTMTATATAAPDPPTTSQECDLQVEYNENGRRGTARTEAQIVTTAVSSTRPGNHQAHRHHQHRYIRQCHTADADDEVDPHMVMNGMTRPPMRGARSLGQEQQHPPPYHIALHLPLPNPEEYDSSAPRSQAPEIPGVPTSAHRLGTISDHESCDSLSAVLPSPTMNADEDEDDMETPPPTYQETSILRQKMGAQKHGQSSSSNV